jgi:phosphoribosylformimino-5-aminoimidazole carboxamide ribotide isomerase
MFASMVFHFNHRSRFLQKQMAILPVLDLMQGQIVRGIAGRRDEYRPIVSQLVASAEPLLVAETLRERFGFNEFYLADLDAIQGGQPNDAIYDALVRRGFALWIDAGVSSAAFLATPNARLIVGLESVQGPDALAQIIRNLRHGSVVFSLDLKDGLPLGKIGAWGSTDPWTIARRAIEIGVESMIVLDLARVGVGGGTGTEELCVRLKQTYPDLQLTAGGGVRGMDDVRRLHSLGVDYVLVASALHDGRITPEEVKRC